MSHIATGLDFSGMSRGSSGEKRRLGLLSNQASLDSAAPRRKTVMLKFSPAGSKLFSGHSMGSAERIRTKCRNPHSRDQNSTSLFQPVLGAREPTLEMMGLIDGLIVRSAGRGHRSHLPIHSARLHEGGRPFGQGNQSS